jgi:hypothetical protein
MGRSASHGEPRRMNGPEIAGPSPFEACSAALRAAERAPLGDGHQVEPASSIFRLSNDRHTFAASRRSSPELCFVAPPSQAKRAQGRPGAGWHPRSAARKVAQKNRTAAYRCSRTHGLPCAMVGRLMPCSPGSRTFLLASLAPRIDDAVRPVGLARISARGLTVATTARTTRFCRTRIRWRHRVRRRCARCHRNVGTTNLTAPLVCTRFRAHRDYPPCPHPSCRRCRVHRKPGSRIVTTT